MKKSSDFEGMEKAALVVASPPNKKQRVKDSNTIKAFWFNGSTDPRPLKKRYNIAQIKKILQEEYNGYQLICCDEYKSTRYSYYKTYQIVDKSGAIVVPRCYLHNIGDVLLSDDNED